MAHEDQTMEAAIGSPHPQLVGVETTVVNFRPNKGVRHVPIFAK